MIEGNLLKMRTSIENDTVQYQLVLNDSKVDLNKLIGKSVKLTYKNQINCISCGKITSKSFGQGFCYSCFQTAPEAEECVLNPEKCRAHLGESRDQQWAEEHCLIPHYVYLAVASGIKVGVTRHTQIPTRWIDQGAWKAVIIAETPNRHIAGVIESFLKQYFSDKTNWRNMLKNQLAEEIDLIEEQKKAIEFLPKELQKYAAENSKATEINYPVLQYPLKPQSVTFDKELSIEGILQGIKGQYLLFDNDRVINIRRHSGYLVQIEE
ncbi:DUF2797 domain-containing protein [Carboxylicivirga caseinilyticus]|uniref:DUF2797 domain-containing protein n=1 Tax=Carboxylicivirga caseinilyticus TaxID=3417572 RepID=UPI003D32EAC8|nr:DUF2797 domain-containing protein [Marinilabiliaceae bacterium A049]